MSTEARLARIDDILSRKQPTLQVMLYNVYNAQNLSNIIRISDAVGMLDIFYSSLSNKTLRIRKTITPGAHRWTLRHHIKEEVIDFS